MNEATFEQMKTGAAVVDRSDLGLLKITGDTRTDLLHRMSTQDLRGIQAGDGRATVFTTEIGRIIDRAIVFAGDDFVYMLTGENNADTLARYLMRFVFFNDDFQIAPVNDVAITGVYGGGAQAALQAAGLLTGELALYGWRESVYRVDPIAGDGYLVLGDAAVADTLSAHGALAADAQTFEFLRVASGQPGFGRELSADYIPLEADLWSDVSFNKGCYIGQEIIARMESRGKLAKRLVSLSLAAPVAAGTQLLSNGKKAGSLTSVSGLYALGYVKTAILESGATLQTADGVAVSLRD